MVRQVSEQGLHLQNKTKAVKPGHVYSTQLGLPSIQREASRLNLGFSCYTDDEGDYHTKLQCKCTITSAESVPAGAAKSQAQGTPATALKDPAPAGLGWIVLEDTRVSANCYRLQIKKTQAPVCNIQSPSEVKDFLRTVQDTTLDNFNKLGLRTILLMDELVAELKEDGCVVEVTGTTLRGRLLQPGTPTLQLVESGILLLVAHPGNHLVPSKDEQVFLTVIKGSTKTVIKDIIVAVGESTSC